MSSKKVVAIISLISTIAFLLWLAFDPGWENFVGVLGSMAFLIGSISSDDNGGPSIMKQIGGKGSNNYQAKGDININQGDKR